MTRDYRRWIEISETLDIRDVFGQFNSILELLDLTVKDAFNIFTSDYELAVSPYTNEEIIRKIDFVRMTNKYRYQKLAVAAVIEYDPIANYDMTEKSTDTRTPDLTNELTLNTTSDITDTRATTTNGSSDTTTKNQLNQQHTTIDTPTGFEETSIHYENPYDNPGFKEASKDTITQSGSRTVTESYSGNPDETTTNVSGSSTTTNSGGTKTVNSGTNTSKETGTEKTEHTLTRKGNIGVTSSQQLIESEIALAEKLNIFKIIEQDIAAKIFLQVWI